MSLALFIPKVHESRYSLLGTMAAELTETFARAGSHVNPTEPVSVRGAVYLFLNMPASLAQLWAWAGVDGQKRPRQRSALLQFFVDHPLGLDPALLDALSAAPHYRLLMPCADDVHWFRLRFPGLRHLRCPHGVPEWALCQAAAVDPSHAEGRELGVLVTGSIHTRAELVKLREAVPAPVRAACEDLVEFQLRNPWASFGQAFELTMAQGVYASDHWRLMQVVWRYTTASLNRARRTGMVRAMQGLPVTIIGSDAWKEFATGTITHRGEAAYAELPAWFARAKVSLAWGPTQFVHSYSERVLLAMAGGCACVADDRALLRAEVGEACRVFDAAEPDQAAQLADELLNDADGRARLGREGRELVERSHLWKHRLELLVSVALDAMGIEPEAGGDTGGRAGSGAS